MATSQDVSLPGSAALKHVPLVNTAICCHSALAHMCESLNLPQQARTWFNMLRKRLWSTPACQYDSMTGRQHLSAHCSMSRQQTLSISTACSRELCQYASMTTCQHDNLTACQRETMLAYQRDNLLACQHFMQHANMAPCQHDTYKMSALNHGNVNIAACQHI